MTAAEPSAGVLIDGEHRLAVRVYHEDTDFTGVVYHGGYVRFLERGRSDFLRLIGIHHEEMAAQDVAFAVTRLEIDFRRAARIGDALIVVTRLTEARGAHVRFDQAIRCADLEVVSAHVKVACINGAGRARRPPAALATALIARVL